MKTKTKPEIIKVERHKLETLKNIISSAYFEEYEKNHQVGLDAISSGDINYGVFTLNTLSEIDLALQELDLILEETEWQ